MDQLLTTTEVAEILGISPGTLRNWRIGKKPRRLPYVILNDGRSIRYELADVMKLRLQYDRMNEVRERVEVGK